MDHLQYLALLVGCLVFTIPLEFIYGFRVWRDPRKLARALVPCFAFFVAWDLIAIARGNWWFSDQYTIGVRVPGNIPIEELLFFIIVPAAAISSLEAVKAQLKRWADA